LHYDVLNRFHTVTIHLTHMDDTMTKLVYVNTKMMKKIYKNTLQTRTHSGSNHERIPQSHTHNYLPWTIFLDLIRTRIIFLHAHPQAHATTVQSFINICSSVWEELCLQEIWTDIVIPYITQHNFVCRGIMRQTQTKSNNYCVQL